MILHGDCRQQLATLPDCSVDAIVTDPPYELGFMGKKWDASGIAYDPEVWSQCLRVLKPGGHLLAFGGTRTYHRMTVAIEDAGFEIRDSIHWIYGSGFPKSLDVSKSIDKGMGHWRGKAGNIASTNGAMKGPNYERTEKGDPVTAAAAAAAGWGTALKPAHEPIVLARKPLAGTVAANVMEYGTGALNIDACRVGSTVETWPTTRSMPSDGVNLYTRKMQGDDVAQTTSTGAVPPGRWPANIILTHSPECEQTGTTDVPATSGVPQAQLLNGISGAGRTHSRNGDQWTPTFGNGDGTETVTTWNCVPSCPVATLNEQSGTTTGVQRTGFPGGRTFGGGEMKASTGQWFGDSGGASRFFTTTEWDADIDVPFLYVAKPSRKERNAGLDGMPERFAPTINNGIGGKEHDPETATPKANFHPTVKPVALIRYLIRLITPPDGTVLDPFLGSGTTAVAAILEGFDWIGCELTDNYLPIIEARTTWAKQNRPEPDLTLFTEQP